MKTNFKTERMFERVADFLEAHVKKNLKPGDRLPGIKVLSKELGVSEWTLRSAQALLAQSGVLDVRHGSGVFMATPTERASRIGIYCAYDILNPRTSSFHQQVPYHLREWLKEKGLASEIYVGDAKPNEEATPGADLRFCRDVEANRLNGMVLLNVNPTREWLEWEKKVGIPSIGLTKNYKLTSNSETLIKIGLKTLLRAGCQKIALMSWGMNGRSAEPFKKALEAVGLEYHPEWVTGDLHPALNGAGWEEFRELWSARSEKPDGILIDDDLLFSEACHAIQEMGISVPDELRIVARSNAGSRNHSPVPVTLVESNPREHAEIIGQQLMARLQGEPAEPVTTELTYTIREEPGHPAAKPERKPRKARA